MNKIKIDDTKEILKILNPIITNYVDKIGHIVVSKGTIANYPENWWNDESNSYDSMIQ